MSGRERHTFGVRSVEPFSARSARLYRVGFAWREESRVVQLEREVQQVAREQHPLTARLEKDTSMSRCVTGRMQHLQVRRHLPILDGGVELSRRFQRGDDLCELADVLVVGGAAHPLHVGPVHVISRVREPWDPPARRSLGAPPGVIRVHVREDDVVDVGRYHTERG